MVLSKHVKVHMELQNLKTTFLSRGDTARRRKWLFDSTVSVLWLVTENIFLLVQRVYYDWLLKTIFTMNFPIWWPAPALVLDLNWPTLSLRLVLHLHYSWRPPTFPSCILFLQWSLRGHLSISPRRSSSQRDKQVGFCNDGRRKKRRRLWRCTANFLLETTRVFSVWPTVGRFVAVFFPMYPPFATTTRIFELIWVSFSK